MIPEFEIGRVQIVGQSNRFRVSLREQLRTGKLGGSREFGSRAGTEKETFLNGVVSSLK